MSGTVFVGSIADISSNNPGPGSYETAMSSLGTCGVGPFGTDAARGDLGFRAKAEINDGTYLPTDELEGRLDRERGSGSMPFVSEQPRLAAVARDAGEVYDVPMSWSGGRSIEASVPQLKGLTTGKCLPSSCANEIE